jgi:hypothetical protein
LSEVKELVASIPLHDQRAKLQPEISKKYQFIRVSNRCFGPLSLAPVDEQVLYHSSEIQILLVEVLIDG